MAGLYIHIPFCHSKCIYCDFYSTPRLSLVDSFLDAIPVEFAMRRDEIAQPFTTLYIGGGTPSIIPPERLARLISGLPLDNVGEFTIEVNPEDVNASNVTAWRDMGINRISMGIQSFDDSELKSIRRRHSASDASQAVETLLYGGLSNISCDLIYGLPWQTLSSWEQSLTRLLTYDLPHLSAYCLSYEHGTALHAAMTAGRVSPADDALLYDMYTLLCERTADKGYLHYEISNFSRPGMQSRHNSSYWRDVPYLGLGPGAHSYDGHLRRSNVSDIKLYVESPASPIIEYEDLNQRFNDTIITALRTSSGLDLRSIDSDRRRHLERESRRFIGDGDIIISPDGNHMHISESAWFHSDYILRELIII